MQILQGQLQNINQKNPPQTIKISNGIFPTWQFQSKYIQCLDVVAHNPTAIMQETTVTEFHSSLVCEFLRNLFRIFINVLLEFKWYDKKDCVCSGKVWGNWGLTFINRLSKQMMTLHLRTEMHWIKDNVTKPIAPYQFQYKCAIYAHSQAQGYVSIIDSVVMNSKSEGIL